MSTTFTDKLIQYKYTWQIVAFLTIAIYLYPLLDLEHLYILEFDNLDSNIVWNKILAESGKIFASNHEIIPNMMSGLPRSSYGSEFDIMLWLYYLFSPPIAYAVNEAIIHIVAFFISTYISQKIYDFRFITKYYHDTTY